jgi:predicted nucleic acid-binding protein
MSTEVQYSGARPKPTHLADTSALVYLRFAEVDSRLSPLIAAGTVARCGIVDLEILVTARNHQELVALRQARDDAFPLVAMDQVDFERAMDVMALLAAAGKHRSAKVSDLLIAAVAERAQLVLLHYDHDFDVIAGVTGQPVEWVAPRGSLP